MFSRALRAAAFLVLATSLPALAQSTAMNGSLEGTVRDATGAVLPGVSILISNAETGTSRSVVSGSDGAYRVLLLPLGTYHLKGELQGFKTAERTGVRLSAGQAAVVNLSLEVGGVTEVVTVSGEAPVTEPGKIDLGRTIGETEVKNLPLVSRNPYNLAFLQANVTGYENEEFGVPRINANGSQMHTNYQIDGNTNTQKDRAGLRLLPVSEVMVREVKVITSGFAPEFGQTTGMVYNAVTPSGTNAFHGSASYRLRRKGLSERPFFLAPTAKKPDTYVNNYTATLGGPLQKDKWHFYLGYEYVDRDLSADRVITVTPDTAQRLSLSPGAVPSSGVIPASQGVNFFLGKTDYQVTAQNKLSARYFFFNNSSPYNIAGGLNTVERATDFADRMDSASLQLVSSWGALKLNELRVQFARRHQSRTASEGAGTGSAIVVSSLANFGAPTDGTQSVGFDFTQDIWQVLDNFSVVRGRHNLKIGFDAQLVEDARLNTLRQIYTFPSANAYVAARSGQNPRSYSNFVQDLGNPAVDYDSAMYALFVQDDFRVSSRLKILYGLRYDLFAVPDSRPFAANPASRSFRVDKNNFGPRAGFVWTPDHDARTVLRGSVGVMYEPPLLNFYEDAILRNGDPRTFSVTLNPTSGGAPAFPNTLANLPAGFTPPPQSIVTVDPDFSTQYNILTNLQVERGLSSDVSVALGYVSSQGRNLPVLLDGNIVPTGRTLGDGRPVFATAVNAQTRVNPVFNHVDSFQSIGESSYHALTFTLNKRMSRGVQLQATYTLARGKDNAPLTGTYVVGSNDDRISNPASLDYDLGPTIFNQTHTLVMSGIIAPKVEGEGLGRRLLNHNQLGFILQANSGLPVNIRANTDLNLDGALNDRPLGVTRNSGKLGRVINLDARYSRFLPLRGQVRGELFVEAKNVFNTENVANVNRVVTVDALGNPSTGLPAELPPTGGYLQRNVQVGLKVTF